MKSLKFLLILVIGLTQIVACTQNKQPEVKNVIIMIPDGTSLPLLTLARWYMDGDLAFDPYISGTIKTHCIDGKFPDSAPAGTAFSTGVKTIAPYIGLDSSGSPRVSVLQLAKRKGLATGIVVTCEFPHATPAAFVAHFNDREGGRYRNLTKQFIYNSPDLVFAGGEQFLRDNGYHQLLKSNNINLITDKEAFKKETTLPASPLWALFPDWQGNTRNLSYECDRNPANAPSLSEMTAKAIQLLQQNKNGFFLMVEGSQVDWAAHGNDPYAAVTDLLEFDKAVAVALKFAKENKNTVVIICSDHGTGGITLGNERSSKSYQETSIVDAIIRPLRAIEASGGSSGRKLAELILSNSAYISSDSLQKYYNIIPSAAFLRSIKETAAKGNLWDLQALITQQFSRENYIGWTTSGHTAEDVFLAIYAPKNVQRITGVVNNDSIGRYMANILNLEDLNTVTKELFTKHSEFFNENEITSGLKASDSLLVVQKNGKTFTFEANTNIVKMEGEQEERLSSIVVKINTYGRDEKGAKVFKHATYYLPKSIEKFIH